METGVIPQDPPVGKDWEEELYREGCALLREEARRKLQALDEWLHAQAPPGWRVVGFRERTMVCRFGAVTVSRRLYRDEGGRYHFLLDEHLGWEPYRAATPLLQEAAVVLAARNSFREAARMLEKLTAGVLSVMTLQRLVQATAEKAIAQEREEVKACFERWEVPEGGEWFRGSFWKRMGCTCGCSGRREGMRKSGRRSGTRDGRGCLG